MKRPRATQLGRAGLLLPMLLATACAAIAEYQSPSGFPADALALSEK